MSTQQVLPSHSTEHRHTAATNTRQRVHQRKIRKTHRRWIGWAAAVAITAIAIVAVVIGGRTTPSTSQAGNAPSFQLASTSGTEVSLADFKGKNVLLFFNEGVGCDACFYQLGKVESDGALERAGVTLLPIVMNTAPDVQGQLDRFNLRTPHLLDPNGTTSEAYDVLGRGHHANLPGHTFILVGPDGTIRWRGDYPGMWIEPSELAAAVTENLG
jgi:peroxiredoxin